MQYPYQFNWTFYHAIHDILIAIGSFSDPASNSAQHYKQSVYIDCLKEYYKLYDKHYVIKQEPRT